jgi:hypothetical protein
MFKEMEEDEGGFIDNISPRKELRYLTSRFPVLDAHYCLFRRYLAKKHHRSCFGYDTMSIFVQESSLAVAIRGYT